MVRKPVKDGLGKNVRDYIFNPAENKFEHKDELVHESSQPTLPGVNWNKQKDIKVDMIIVDYGDLLKPIKTTREKRHDLETIYEELRAIAQEQKCPLWTASQTNRSGLNAEVVTMESISEAYSKCFVADFIFSISRTIDDRNNNTGRIFIAKNRFGPDGIIYPAKMDLSKVKISILPSTGETPGEVQIKAAKHQAQVLREKYKQYKQSKKQNDKN